MVEAELRDDDADKIETIDPDDDDIHLNDIAHLYIFKEWWIAGQQPIGLGELLAMPDGLWDDFKQLLGKYSQFKRILKSKRSLAKPTEREDLF